MKDNDILHLDLFDVYIDNPNFKPFEFYEPKCIPIPKANVFNFDKNETKVFYKYYFKLVDSKYFLNFNLSFTGIIVFYGFILYCRKNSLDDLRNKAFEYFERNIHECYFKDFFIFLEESYVSFLKDELVINESFSNKVYQKFDSIYYDIDVNGEFCIRAGIEYVSEENDIFINLNDFLNDLFDNDIFIESCFYEEFKNTRRVKINNIKLTYNEIIDWIINFINDKKDYKNFIKNDVELIIKKINDFLINYSNINFLSREDIEIKENLYYFLGYLSCIKKSNKTLKEKVVDLQSEFEKKKYQIIEEKEDYHEDYYEDKNNEYSFYDSSFYDADLDLDQQDADFDF